MKREQLELTQERARRLIEKEDATTSMYINDISKLFEYRISRQHDGKGVSHGYRKMLGLLMDKDGVTQLELVKSCRLSAPSVSIALSKLEADGFVRREADKTDYRKVRVFITDKGREHENNIRALCRKNDSDMLKGLSEEEIETVNYILKKILINMLEEIDNNEAG